VNLTCVTALVQSIGSRPIESLPSGGRQSLLQGIQDGGHPVISTLSIALAMHAQVGGVCVPYMVHGRLRGAHEEMPVVFETFEPTGLYAHQG
jgi:hypothetical protein